MCNYLDNKSDKKYNYLEGLIEIYKYIPINIYDNIKLYILLKNGLNSINIEYIKNIKKIIYVKNIYIFLNLLYKKKKKNEFLIIFKNCNNIIKHYENNIL